MRLEEILAGRVIAGHQEALEVKAGEVEGFLQFGGDALTDRQFQTPMQLGLGDLAVQTALAVVIDPVVLAVLADRADGALEIRCRSSNNRLS